MIKKHVDDSPERVTPVQRRDLGFYLVLFCLVIPLCSVIPISWMFVVYSLYTGSASSFTWRGRTCFLVALAEVFFSIHHYNLTRFISGPSTKRPGNIPELQSAFHRVLQAGLADLPEDGFDEESLDVDRPGSPAETIKLLSFNDPRAVDFRNYLRTWFGKVPWSSIRREQMSMWLHWSIFNSTMPPHAIPHAHSTAINQALENIEKRAGCKIPEGSNLNVKPILLTLDPVNVSFRPFFLYAGIAIGNFISRAYLQHKCKVQFGVHEGLEYLIRIPDDWTPENPHTRPIVFIHGLGLGLTQYAMFVTRLMTTLPEHPILVPIQPHISQNIFHPRFVFPMGRYEMTRCLVGLLRKLRWVSQENEEPSAKNGRFGVTMLSHSNGSFAHAWFTKAHPEMIARSCFIDPVTFCTWEGDLCYDFLYRPCTTAFDLLMYYFIASELGVANSLQRHFDWTSNSLWYEEIPNARDSARSLFVLGGQDAIVKSERVLRYLRSHGIRNGLIFTPDHHHGAALLPGTEVHSQIMDWLRG